MKRVVAIVIDFGRHRRNSPTPSTTATRREPIRSATLRERRFAATCRISSAGARPFTPISPASRRVERPQARVARLRERSRGKDTITGHWEMMGIMTDVRFPPIRTGFRRRRRRGVHTDRRQGCRWETVRPRGPRSSTRSAGASWPRAGPILYTSADSVFQIAAHEEVVPLGTLYEWCDRHARDAAAPS